MNCLWCKSEFTPTRPWHKFCKVACRVAFDRASKKVGIHIADVLMTELESLADAQQTSVTEMANRILHNALNPGSRPLTDTEVYGVTKQQEATDGH